ncbi:hypothetical protein M231_06128 [Tremella mesenterica]|uniref:Uncharacterized protein n=1 Tax=Tremella mesenterica TaxID=5217 RepID=A0A4Q1BE21_TREME|nr:hypothetical protein M231_06128 [Tremella mesenterica]
MPREDYASPTLYTISIFSRTIRIILYTVLGVSVICIGGFELMHLNIEHRSLSTPSGVSTSSEDEYGWQEENQGWTGGPKGGTDPRLGWKGRLAVRTAWSYQNEGSGGLISSIDNNRHDRISRSSVSVPSRGYDKGYEMAAECLDQAIEIAEKKGIEFPPSFYADASGLPKAGMMGQVGDSTAVDLFMLKAGVLERIGKPSALTEAKDLYERVLPVSMDQETVMGQKARRMRLAGKIGDLHIRLGDEKAAMGWWVWGLGLAQINPNTSSKLSDANPSPKGWFSWLRKPNTVSIPLPVESTTESIDTLPPFILRATISLLIFTSAQLAKTNQLLQAESIQKQALYLLEKSSTSTSPTSPLITDGKEPSPSGLWSLWITHRQALLNLHLASVRHARSLPALDMCSSASHTADNVLASLTPLPTLYATRSSPLYPHATRLREAAMALAAEAAYTSGLLLEKSGTEGWETAVECFQHAMKLVGGSGEEEGAGRGEEWSRYYRGFARVRSKMDSALQGK